MKVVHLAEMDIGVRSAQPNDEAVVMSAWLRGHHMTGDWPRRVSKGRYFDEHKVTVTKLLANSATLVACNPERESQVLGYMCSNGALHWVYVKETFRRNGIAGALWAALGKPAKCTHWTLPARRWLRSWGLRYDPFLLEEA